jgi:hypothetical protein
MEPPRLLHDLASRNPQHTFAIISTCRDDPQACGFPPNVVNTWTPERLAWYSSQVKPFQEIMRQVSKTDMAMLDAIRGIEGVIDTMLLPLAEKMEGAVIWSGQHGTANSVLPSVTDRSGIPGFTRPYDSFTFYGGGIFRLINAWRDLDPKRNEEVWLIADARNHLKARDQKWPLRHPVLGQFNFTRDLHHERFGDKSNPAEFFGYGDREETASWKTDHTWKSRISYVYSGLEACGVMPEHVGHWYTDDNFNQRAHFGLFINEAGGHVGQGADQKANEHKLGRATITRDWVLPIQPAFIHGKWTKASMEALSIDVTSVPFDQYFPTLRTVKCTFTTPSSYSGWATTKAWEAFAVGTVCFRHPEYDTQDHIYGRLPDEVRGWLSPKTPEDLKARVEFLNGSEVTWKWLVQAQYDLYLDVVLNRPWLQKIEERLFG